jgi:2-dehydro-3-deoxyphosphogluconate aldolase / (4S)-4-hydroxy-2-oxoglutarate aldolase
MRNKMNDTSEIFACPIVPVLTVSAPEQAVPLAETLGKAGFTALEVTFRTPHAAEAIAAMRKACPDLHIGAGTITGAAQFDAACAVGSDFLVSPGTGPALFELFKQASMPVFPGIATPSEAIAAYEQGYKVQKFFPASANGGTAMLKAMSAPLADISFMPTGGIGRENMQEYLDLPNVVAIGGSWMIDAKALAAGDWDAMGAYAERQIQA